MKQIEYGGVIYRCHADFAKVMGVSNARVTQWIRNGRRGNIGVAAQNLDRNGVPVTLDGMTYPSAAAASRALGISKYKVLRMAASSEKE